MAMVKQASESSEYASSSEGEEEETKSKAIGKVVEGVTKQQVEAPVEDESDTDSDSDPVPPIAVIRKVIRPDSQMNPAGKRGREVNGSKGGGVFDEPANKKKKEERVRKPTSPGKGEKGSKGVVKVVIRKGENAKPQAASRKRKASPPPAARQQEAAQKVAEASSPLKTKKVFHWTTALEMELASYLLRDVPSGSRGMPSSKADPYWEELLSELSVPPDVNVAQLLEKIRRSKGKYAGWRDRAAKEGSIRFIKKPDDLKLFRLWEQFFDSGPRPTKSQAANEDEETDGESDGAGPRPLANSQGAAVREAKGGDHSSEDENEEDEGLTENVQRKTAGLNELNASKSPAKDKINVVSPFVSKPLLPFTPLPAKEDGKSASKKAEELITGDQLTGDVGLDSSGKDVGKHAVDVVAEGRWSVPRGQFSSVAVVEYPRLQETLGFCFQPTTTPEIQMKWAELQVRELAIASERSKLRQAHDELLLAQYEVMQEELNMRLQLSGQDRN